MKRSTVKLLHFKGNGDLNTKTSHRMRETIKCLSDMGLKSKIYKTLIELSKKKNHLTLSKYSFVLLFPILGILLTAQ